MSECAHPGPTSGDRTAAFEAPCPGTPSRVTMLRSGMIEAGLVLSDKYRLVREIGRGGMGSVWLAKRLDLNADVAVKVMRTDAAAKPGALARFRREAKSAAALRSPHVVQILDCGVDAATGVAFISMELLDGESLAQRLARLSQVPAPEVASIVAQVARGLARAHGAGIIHRDLKPANIFLVKNEDAELAKLLDFGIAKDDMGSAQHDMGSAQWRTSTGTVVGTPHYMSPEQIDPARPVDHRTDLYSLAVIACEALVGKRPFEAGTLSELALKISLGRSRVPSSLGSVPSGFDEWFARATHLDPGERFQSAIDLARALGEVCARGAAPLEAGAFALAATQELDSFEGVADARHPAPQHARWASRGQRAPMSMRAWVWLSVAGVILAVVTLGSVLRPKARDVPQEYTTVTALSGAALAPGAPLAQTTATEAAVTPAPPSGEPSAAPTAPAKPAASAEAPPAPRARSKPAPRAAVASAPVAKPPPDTTPTVTTPSPEPAPQPAVDPFDLH
jgi:hypothetical protein